MITDRDIARWRLRSQSLAAPLDDAEQVVRSLLAVQAENPSQSAWAVATRTSSSEAADLAVALASGRVIRTHVLRPTWHYVHADDVRRLVELTAPRVLPVFEQQLRPIAGRMTAITDTIEEVLGEASDRTRSELGAALAGRGTELTGQQLMLVVGRLEMLGLVCSGAPRDGEHTYAPMDARVPAGRPFDRDEALAELALRYCTGHGPATERDLAYWATLTVTDARRGIAAVADRLESFEHDGRTFWHAPGGPPSQAEAPEPAGHLLQLLDEMYRGYQDSRWVIDSEGVVPRERETAIGVALVDAQLVAAMKRTVTAKAVTFSLRPHRALAAHERQAIDDAAARYAAFLGLEPRVVFDA
ncbi:winged helix DNA-binding domain-containing protein [Agromyces italicus]|uniref:winged helix DNA-binding domain-containing protein n=1 Tax=Agromyces italicus TaxID=279572 RepID=UPI0003B43A7C|nr:winged helix DNA-binding domain-containing protein [Agromyces italicus]